MTRPEILDKAKACVCGQREQDYGSPENNFKIIGELWTAYKGVDFSPLDVSMMMALLKIGRISSGTATEDSFVDLAGYAACGGEIAMGEKQNKYGSEHHPWSNKLPSQNQIDALLNAAQAGEYAIAKEAQNETQF